MTTNRRHLLTKSTFVAATAAFALLAGGCGKEDSSSASVPPTPGAKPYPLKTCLVSGEPLGSMGEPPVMVHGGQEIKFCCKDCIKEFEGDPAKFLARLAP